MDTGPLKPQINKMRQIAHTLTALKNEIKDNLITIAIILSLLPSYSTLQTILMSQVLESRYWEGNGERGRVRTHSGAYRRTMVSEEASKPHILWPKPKFPTWSWVVMGNQLQTFKRTLPYFSCNFISFYSILKAILFIFPPSPEHMTYFFILRPQGFSL